MSRQKRVLKSKKRKNALIYGIIALLLIFTAVILIINKGIFSGITGNVILKPGQNLTGEIVDVVADEILLSINDGNYRKFSENFSPQIREELKKETFENMRNILSETSGKYLSKTAQPVAYSDTSEIHMYQCVFEKETVMLKVTVSNNDVDGVYFDSANLRKFMGG